MEHKQQTEPRADTQLTFARVATAFAVLSVGALAVGAVAIGTLEKDRVWSCNHIFLGDSYHRNLA